MSWYYSYYIGRKKGDKIELIGVYDNKGKIYPALELSRSFASSLKNRFIRYDGEIINDTNRSDLISVLPYRELPKDDYIKSGYFLIKDVEKYLINKDSYGLFYERLSPEVYVEKLKTESVLGVPKQKKDDEGYDIETYSCSDYMYFSYPDYFSEEYESFIIKEIIDVYGLLDKDDDVVIVMYEG